MTHEQEIKALNEAGDRLAARERIEAESSHSDTATSRRIWASLKYNETARDARDSIKLLAEIAEAAREVRKAEKNMAREGNFEYAANADWGRKAYVLDALLAKYREAQDAE